MVIFALVFIIANVVDHREFKFDDSEAYRNALEAWSPATAKQAAADTEIKGELAFFSINCFSEKIFGDKEYVGFEQANKRFISSDVKNADDVGAFAVLYYDRVSYGTYNNGAAAWQKVCYIYILDKTTLYVLGEDKVMGEAPDMTTSGGDRTGKTPKLSLCRDKAEQLLDELSN